MILLSGVAIVCAAVVLIISDIKKNKELVRVAEAERNELQSIIDDAELMVDELNNFSDYIISQIEQKNSEVGQHMSKLDEKLKKVMETQVRMDLSGARFKGVKYAEDIADNKAEKTKRLVFKMAQRSRGSSSAENKPYDIRLIKEKGAPKSARESALDLVNNKKYGNVLKYSKEGMSEAEIARSLNIGKGEVELIIGLKDYYEKSKL